MTQREFAKSNRISAIFRNNGKREGRVGEGNMRDETGRRRGQERGGEERTEQVLYVLSSAIIIFLDRFHLAWPSVGTRHDQSADVGLCFSP